jgi:hypothetical protein
MWGNKKAKPLINNDLALSFVTSRVEKSNFYKELNTLIDWEFTTQITKEK